VGTLRRISGERQLELRRSHVVGRAPNSDLALYEGHISLQHACIRWTANGWELKDLASANGTYVNGTKVISVILAKGDKIGFGRDEQAWELTDASSPRVMAVPDDGGDALYVEGGVLAIPSQDDPRASIYRNSKDQWILESTEDTTALADQQSFTVDGKGWTFHSPEAVLPTSTFDEPEANRVLDATLHFKVSADEEHVELSVECGGRQIDLGSRAHHYLLLTLARRKLTDALRPLPPTVCGWVYQDDLTRDLRISPAQLNVDIFRIRQQFGAIGLVDSGSIVQRRPRTKQLRVGSQRITETPV
jgi:hypothetical protein